MNVLLDTLVRPNGETDDSETTTSVVWQHIPQTAVAHLAIGTSPCAGGQWTDNPIKASWDIGTLSYAGMLSLPGYSFAEHYQKYCDSPIPQFLRPSRRMVADYFAAYPSSVGIANAIHSGQKVAGVTRLEDGFHVASHNIKCKHLVLASGIFSELVPARPLLQPLLNLPGQSGCGGGTPLLVVGSGFSAADVILSTPPSQKIIHIFKWAPSTSPSPLKACHQQAYPEYAGVYRRMKISAMIFVRQKRSRPGLKAQRGSSEFDTSRDWASNYEGLPNTAIVDVKVEADTAIVMLQRANEPTFQRRISGFFYVVGRRGSLGYLATELRHEVCGSLEDSEMLSGQTLRKQAIEDLQVAPDVFITGSLTGDSLIRFAYGSCVYAAGKIMKPASAPVEIANGCIENRTPKTASPFIWTMNGLDGHNASPTTSKYVDEPLDRRKDNA